MLYHAVSFWFISFNISLYVNLENILRMDFEKNSGLSVAVSTADLIYLHRERAQTFMVLRAGCKSNQRPLHGSFSKVSWFLSYSATRTTTCYLSSLSAQAACRL